MLVLQRPSGAVFLTLPTTAPTGSLELVAGVLAHHAARGDTTSAQRLLHADLHAPRGDRRLTTVRAEGLGHWIEAQRWLRYRTGVVRPTVELPLTFVDGVLGPLLAADPRVRRVVLIEALVVAGYTLGAARVAVQRAPYLATPGRP